MSGRCVEVDVGALVARYAVSAFSRSVLLVVVGRGSLAVGVENECHIPLDALSNSLAFPQRPSPPKAPGFTRTFPLFHTPHSLLSLI